MLPKEGAAREGGKGLWSKCGAAGPASTVGPAVGTPGLCHPSYPDVCIAPALPDLDYVDVTLRRFRVVGADPHRSDTDRDGIGSE